jgi:hypothetical protein
MLGVAGRVDAQLMYVDCALLGGAVPHIIIKAHHRCIEEAMGTDY